MLLFGDFTGKIWITSMTGRGRKKASFFIIVLRPSPFRREYPWNPAINVQNQCGKCEKNIKTNGSVERFRCLGLNKKNCLKTKTEKKKSKTFFPYPVPEYDYVGVSQRRGRSRLKIDTVSVSSRFQLQRRENDKYDAVDTCGERVLAQYNITSVSRRFCRRLAPRLIRII